MSFLQLFVAVLALGYITFVFVYSEVMLWLRELIGMLSLAPWAILGVPAKHVKRMLSCPFCTGFWVTAVVQLVFRFDIFDRGIPGVLLTWPGLTCVAAFIAFLAGHAIEHLPKPPECRREGQHGLVQD